MPRDIKKDLKLFNQLAHDFIEEETNNPISKYLDPNNAKKELDFKLTEEGVSDDYLVKCLKNILLRTPKSSSRLFFNQLYGGRHGKAVVGDLLTVLLNNSMATYKIAGPQVVIEKEVLSQVYGLIGYDKKNAGGTFPTGGSMCNFMSLIMARDKKHTEISESGSTSKLIAYTSENSHYSLSKNASFSGVGRNNVRYIESDKKGRINILSLEKQILKDLKQGLQPFYLNATAGTTVLCAFDNVLKLSEICKQYNIWLHLDGAFGGSVIFSEKYKHLVSGVHLTDSFCFNAHKTLGAPISTSILAVKDKDNLYQSFHNKASYLYQTHDEEFNLGQNSFECGRRNNALKLWSMWKSIGRKGISKIVNHEFKLAEVARNYVNKHSEYTLYSFENSLSVCFNYKDFDAEDICTKLYKNNILMVGFGKFKNNTFIRLVTINAQNTKEDLLQFFKILEKFVLKNQDHIKRR